jgi:hypothetical protein
MHFQGGLQFVTKSCRISSLVEVDKITKNYWSFDEDQKYGTWLDFCA